MNRFQRRPVLYFILLSYGLAWLFALPLWLGAGLEHRYFVAISVLVMTTPALAAAIVSRATDPKVSLAHSLGLAPWRPFARTFKYCLLALLAALLIAGASLLFGATFGLLHFDLHKLSGFSQLLHAKLAGHEDMLARLPPLKLLAWLQVLAIPLAALPNGIVALGEEIGWRGWLLPRLMPLGTVPALALSGVIWALWHAPLILLGYNYPSVPGWQALACMSAMCVVVGAVLAWLRLRSGSVWPAALGHGAFNAAAGVYMVLGDAAYKVDPTRATVLGWSGWIFPALLALVLFHFFRIPDGPPQKL